MQGFLFWGFFWGGFGTEDRWVEICTSQVAQRTHFIIHYGSVEKITKGAGIRPAEIATILCVEDLTLHGNSYSWDCTFKYKMKYQHQRRSPLSRDLWLSSTFLRRNLPSFLDECIAQIFKHTLLLFLLQLYKLQAMLERQFFKVSNVGCQLMMTDQQEDIFNLLVLSTIHTLREMGSTPQLKIP